MVKVTVEKMYRITVYNSEGLDVYYEDRTGISRPYADMIAKDLKKEFTQKEKERQKTWKR